MLYLDQATNVNLLSFKFERFYLNSSLDFLNYLANQAQNIKKVILPICVKYFYSTSWNLVENYLSDTVEFLHVEVTQCFTYSFKLMDIKNVKFLKLTNTYPISYINKLKTTKLVKIWFQGDNKLCAHWFQEPLPSLQSIYITDISFDELEIFLREWIELEIKLNFVIRVVLQIKENSQNDDRLTFVLTSLGNMFPELQEVVLLQDNASLSYFFKVENSQFMIHTRPLDRLQALWQEESIYLLPAATKVNIFSSLFV